MNAQVQMAILVGDIVSVKTQKADIIALAPQAIVTEEIHVSSK